MKHFLLTFSFLALLSLAACTTATNKISNGRNFDESKVVQIQKGQTRAVELIALYGEPDSKDIVSTTQVMWHYTYLNEEHTFHTEVFSPTVETTHGYRKKLDLLLENDVVLNFTYVKTPIYAEKTISTDPW